MASVRPKTIASGGISPKGWTSVFKLPIVMAAFYQLGEILTPAPGEPKGSWPFCGYLNLVYVVMGHQLTKEPL